MKKSTPSLLKIKAETLEDIEIMSALLQDALVPSVGLVHDLISETFTMVLYRYHRASSSSTPDNNLRIISHLHIPKISHLQRYSIDASNPEEQLVLLTLSQERDTLVFTFAGDKALRLITCQTPLYLTDTETCWPTVFTPHHPAI